MKGRKGTKESERGSRKERKAEAGFSEKQEGQLCEDSNTEHFSGCLSKKSAHFERKKAFCHVYHPACSRTLGRNNILRYTPGRKEQSPVLGRGLWKQVSCPCYKDHDHDTGPLWAVGSLRLRPTAGTFVFCVPRCLSCLIQRSFINICYSNEWAKIVYNSAISSCPPEGLK